MNLEDLKAQRRWVCYKSATDKAPAQKDRFSVLASVELITALNRMADTKRISRNALIIQLLTKALKRHIEEAK